MTLYLVIYIKPIHSILQKFILNQRLANTKILQPNNPTKMQRTAQVFPIETAVKYQLRMHANNFIEFCLTEVRDIETEDSWMEGRTVPLILLSIILFPKPSMRPSLPFPVIVLWIITKGGHKIKSSWFAAASSAGRNWYVFELSGGFEKFQPIKIHRALCKPKWSTRKSALSEL